MSIRTERIAQALKIEISYILETEVKNSHIKFVTVTDIKLSDDLGYAKVYVTTLNEDREGTLKALKSAAGYIRHELRERVDIRQIPELNFVYDETIDYANRIEEKLKEIHNN